MAVDYRKEGTIVIITMNNPPMNVLSSAVLTELHGHLDTIEADTEINDPSKQTDRQSDKLTATM